MYPQQQWGRHDLCIMVLLAFHTYKGGVVMNYSYIELYRDILYIMGAPRDVM